MTGELLYLILGWRAEYLNTWSPVVTLCRAGLTFDNSTFCTNTVYLCVLCWYENKQRFLHYIALAVWILGAFAKLLKEVISFVISVSPSVLSSAWNTSATTWRIFIKFEIWKFLIKSVEKIQFLVQYDKNNDCYTWRQIHTIGRVSLSSSYNVKYLIQKSRVKQKIIFNLLSKILSFTG
jgi:hypothetical protein